MAEFREVLLSNEEKATLIGGPVPAVSPGAHVTNPYLKDGKILGKSSLAATNARARIVSIKPRPALAIADGDAPADVVFDDGICSIGITNISKCVTANADELIFSVKITERLHGIKYELDRTLPF